jgi:5'(3')-deoxyribonucleotidase
VSKLTVLVDVDDVVADLVPAWLADYNRAYSDILTPEDIKSWDMTDWVSGECGAKIYEFLNDHTIYDRIVPVPGAHMGVTRLRAMGHRVVFVTSASALNTGLKLTWLIKHGFLTGQPWAQHDFVAAHDKYLVRGDVIIDDRIENVTQFPGGKIIFDRPWNRSLEMTGLGHRMRSWVEADVIVDMVQMHQELEAAA